MGMRILGLDYGDCTVGCAISDPSRTVATPLETIWRDEPEALKKTIYRLREIVNEYQIETIVLGYPRNMNDTEGVRTQKTEAFRKRLLRDIYRVEVILWDERLSTRLAEQPLKELKKDRFERKQVVDQLAAVIILQSYLDQLKHKQEINTIEEKPIMEGQEKQITLYEPTEQLKSVLDVFETLEWKGSTYFLGAVNMGEPDPDDPEEEEEDGVFIFKICPEAESEFLVLKEDGTTDYYVTTVLEEDEEAAVIEAFQEMDGDFDLLLDEE